MTSPKALWDFCGALSIIISTTLITEMLGRRSRHKSEILCSAPTHLKKHILLFVFIHSVVCGSVRLATRSECSAGKDAACYWPGFRSVVAQSFRSNNVPSSPPDHQVVYNQESEFQAHSHPTYMWGEKRETFLLTEDV